jgi:hypothetical protein
MRSRIGTLLLTCATLAALPPRGAGAEADDAVVVIRGADVSVARPLTTERARDGTTEVEIVRIEPAPAPPARKPAAPEREVVVVYVLREEPPAPVGIPVGWAAASHREHPTPHARDRFSRGFQTGRAAFAPVRKGVHGR